MLRVRDTGMGIPPEMLQKVFEPFTQIEDALHRSQGGLGIGLTLVRRLVELHGGTVQAFSEGRGRGSEFVVSLPTLAQPFPALADSQRNSGPHALTECSPRRILLVDDNKDSAESLAILMPLMLGHDVRTAHDGEAGLHVAQQFRRTLLCSTSVCRGWWSGSGAAAAERTGFATHASDRHDRLRPGGRPPSFAGGRI